MMKRCMLVTLPAVQDQETKPLASSRKHWCIHCDWRRAISIVTPSVQGQLNQFESSGHPCHRFNGDIVKDDVKFRR